MSVHVRLRVAVVDDDAQTLSTLAEVVADCGCEVVPFSVPQQAADFLQTERVDGVLLDSKMPQMDGTALAQIIRRSRINSKVPIAMVTGFSDTYTMRSAFSTGISLFLSKPVTRLQIHRLIDVMKPLALRQKRRFTRVPLRVAVQCKYGSRLFAAESVDVSEGGILLATTEVVSIGKRLEMVLRLPTKSKELKLDGEIVRTEPNNIRVRLIDTPDSVSKALKEYVAVSEERSHSEK